LEIRARDERRVKDARVSGMSSEQLAEFERQSAEEKSKSSENIESKEPDKKAASKKVTASSSMISFEDNDDAEDIF
jgi:hypothetical protein